jgi:hypothetical protein
MLPMAPLWEGPLPNSSTGRITGALCNPSGLADATPDRSPLVGTQRSPTPEASPCHTTAGRSNCGLVVAAGKGEQRSDRCRTEQRGLALDSPVLRPHLILAWRTPGAFPIVPNDRVPRYLCVFGCASAPIGLLGERGSLTCPSCVATRVVRRGSMGPPYTSFLGLYEHFARIRPGFRRVEDRGVCPLCQIDHWPVARKTALGGRKLFRHIATANRGTIKPRLLSFTRLLFGHGERTAKETVPWAGRRFRVIRR